MVFEDCSLVNHAVHEVKDLPDL